MDHLPAGSPIITAHTRVWVFHYDHHPSVSIIRVVCYDHRPSASIIRIWRPNPSPSKDVEGALEASMGSMGRGKCCYSCIHVFYESNKPNTTIRRHREGPQRSRQLGSTPPAYDHQPSVAIISVVCYDHQPSVTIIWFVCRNHRPSYGFWARWQPVIHHFIMMCEPWLHTYRR